MLVLVVDDHPIFRQAIRELVESHFPSAVVREASTGAEAYKVLRGEGVDIVVLDIVLPDHSGLTLLKRIKQFNPTTKCLVLSMHDEPHYARLAMAHGAFGYLTKGATAAELREAIRTIHSGGQVISERLAETLDYRLDRSDEQQPHESLSVRELEVLTLVASGRTVSQVAKRLGLSVKTVSTYRGRLLEKLHLQTTADLIRYAIDHHLAN